MTFKLWDRIAQDARLIKLLVAGISFFAIITLLLSIVLLRATEEKTLYIPPVLDGGLHTVTSKAHKSSVYTFAFTVWQLINTWQQDGAQDMRSNISIYRHYLSDDFRNKMDLDVEKNSYKYQGRTKQLLGITEAGPFEETNVQQLTNNSWVVFLKMKVTESFQGENIKDKNVMFALRVNQVQGNRELNPFDLIISGYYDDTKNI